MRGFLFRIWRGRQGAIRIEGACPFAKVVKNSGFWCALNDAHALLELKAKSNASSTQAISLPVPLSLPRALRAR